MKMVGVLFPNLNERRVDFIVQEPIRTGGPTVFPFVFVARFLTILCITISARTQIVTGHGLTHGFSVDTTQTKTNTVVFVL